MSRPTSTKAVFIHAFQGEHKYAVVPLGARTARTRRPQIADRVRDEAVWRITRRATSGCAARYPRVSSQHTAPAARASSFDGLIALLARPLLGRRWSPSCTLAYDSMISEAISSGLLASVPALMLVLDSAGSHNDLTGMAAAVKQGDVQRLAPQPGRASGSEFPTKFSHPC